MITLSLPRVEEPGFQVTTVDAPLPRIRFSGNGDADAVQPLHQFLKRLHEELLIKEAEQVQVDLGELYFMNSSCLKGFVSWIHKVNTTGRTYSIHLLMNPRQQWQLRSLGTLKRLAPEVVVVEELPE